MKGITTFVTVERVVPSIKWNYFDWNSCLRDKAMNDLNG